MKLRNLQCLSAGAAGAAVAGSALGAADGYTPPQLDYTAPWASILLMVLFVVAVLLVAFKRSGRTHLD